MHILTNEARSITINVSPTVQQVGCGFVGVEHEDASAQSGDVHQGICISTRGSALRTSRSRESTFHTGQFSSKLQILSMASSRVEKGCQRREVLWDQVAICAWHDD